MNQESWVEMILKILEKLAALVGAADIGYSLGAKRAAVAEARVKELELDAKKSANQKAVDDKYRGRTDVDIIDDMLDENVGTKPPTGHT